jgi:aryl-alcohol dehydrogenase-like predicted oxidoreductase
MSPRNPPSQQAAPLPTHRIGSLTVGARGLGGLGLSEFYGPVDPGTAVAVIRRALDLGVTLLDTADVHGHGANEELIGKAIAGRRDEAVISAKSTDVTGKRPRRSGLGVWCTWSSRSAGCCTRLSFCTRNCARRSLRSRNDGTAPRADRTTSQPWNPGPAAVPWPSAGLPRLSRRQ